MNVRVNREDRFPFCFFLVVEEGKEEEKRVRCAPVEFCASRKAGMRSERRHNWPVGLALAAGLAARWGDRISRV